MDANSAAEPLGESSPPPSPPPLTQQQIQGLKHFKTLLPLFHHLHEVGCARDRAGNRELFFDDYCAATMLYLLNPLIGSMRSLQHALSLPNVARKVGVKRFSLGSFSEAQRVFEPQRLLAVIEELAGQARPLAKDPRLSQLKQTLTLVDGTALNGLVRLVQAGVDGGDGGGGGGGDGDDKRPAATAKKSFKKAAQGWRLHTQLELDAIAPLRIDVTRGTKGDNHESHVLRKALAGGRCYVFDAGLTDRLLFDDIHAIASTYVGRIRETSVFEVVEERLLSDAALAADVVRDAVVTLGVPGASPMNHAVRIVAVQVTPHPRRTRRKGTKSTRTSDLVLIATDILDLPPELIALIYLYRYTVELFFRLFKHLLGMRHLLSQKKNGVEIQTYLAIIACLLIGLQTGRRPDKRTVEMVGWYLLGLATEQDVIGYLNKPDNRGVKLRAKAELWKKLGY